VVGDFHVCMVVGLNWGLYVLFIVRTVLVCSFWGCQVPFCTAEVWGGRGGGGGGWGGGGGGGGGGGAVRWERAHTPPQTKES